MSKTRLIPFVLGVLILSGACAPEDTEEAPGSDAPAISASSQASLETATAIGVRNARMPVPQLITAGQPTVEQMDQLSQAGFQNFISLRPADENGAGWEEEHVMGSETGFDRLPITGAADLTRDNVEALARILDGAEGQPTVLYCASSNRVGALLALKAHWLDGASPEEAFELGQEAGMTRLADPVRELLGLEPGDSR